MDCYPRLVGRTLVNHSIKTMAAMADRFGLSHLSHTLDRPLLLWGSDWESPHTRHAHEEYPYLLDAHRGHSCCLSTGGIPYAKVYFSYRRIPLWRQMTQANPLRLFLQHILGLPLSQKHDVRSPTCPHII